MTKAQKQLQDFLEKEGFIVHLTKQDNKQCAEVEKWTTGGVDMLIWLNPFTAEELKSYVKDFDVDSQIDLHRGEDKLYKSNFTISQSLTDFTEFHDMLKAVVEKLNS